MTNLSYTIEEAVKMTGLGRTRLYQELNSGRLRAVKTGRRTLILKSDLENWLTSLAAYKAGSDGKP